MSIDVAVVAVVAVVVVVVARTKSPRINRRTVVLWFKVVVKPLELVIYLCRVVVTVPAM